MGFSTSTSGDPTLATAVESVPVSPALVDVIAPENPPLESDGSTTGGMEEEGSIPDLSTALFKDPNLTVVGIE